METRGTDKGGSALHDLIIRRGRLVDGTGAPARPADIAVRKQSDGSYLLVIPELSATSPNNKDNAVTVVRLPKGFDKP